MTYNSVFHVSPKYFPVMNRQPEAVLITAGTKRLGSHLAKATLLMGYSVILHYRTSNRSMVRWLDRNPRFRNRTFFICHELSESPEQVIDEALALPCMLRGLVNNASLFSSGDLLDHNHLQKMLNIHLHVPFRLGNAFYRGAGEGWIINITDAHLNRPSTAYQNYRMSKLFLQELTRQQALLFAPSVRVNALAPGAILPSSAMSRKEFQDLSQQIPLGTTGQVSSLVEGYAFLIKNRYCTGQTLMIDGGWHLI